MRYFYFIFLFFISLPTLGAIQNFTIQGASTDYIPNTSADVWGVFAGPDQLGSPSTSTFNSCEIEPEGGSFIGCHPRRISSATNLVVSFSDDAEFSNQFATAIWIKNEGDATSSREVLIQSNNSLSTGQQGTVSLPWSLLCQKLGGTVQQNSKGASWCAHNTHGKPLSGNFTVEFGFASSGQITLTSVQRVVLRLYSFDYRLAIMPLGRPQTTSPTSPSSTDVPCGDQANPVESAGSSPLADTHSGFCNINMFPGDGGAFLLADEGKEQEQINFINPLYSYAIGYSDDGNTVTNKSSIKYTAIRTYIHRESGIGFSFFPYTQGTLFANFILENPGANEATIENNRTDGLSNGVTYYFRGASVDESGTISALFHEDYYNALCADPTKICPYSATPSEVAGLIQDSSCFITTATYGSPSAYQVVTFKRFREHFLRPSLWGRKLITFYNTYGPKAAHWLNQNPSYKKIVRPVLTPLHIFAHLSLKWGFLLTFFMLLSGPVFIFSVFYLRRKI